MTPRQQFYFATCAIAASFTLAGVSWLVYRADLQDTPAPIPEAPETPRPDSVETTPQRPSSRPDFLLGEGSLGNLMFEQNFSGYLAANDFILTDGYDDALFSEAVSLSGAFNNAERWNTVLDVSMTLDYEPAFITSGTFREPFSIDDLIMDSLIEDEWPTPDASDLYYMGIYDMDFVDPYHLMHDIDDRGLQMNLLPFDFR